MKCRRKGSSVGGSCWACIASDDDDECTTSPGRCPPSLLTRKEDPKLVGVSRSANTASERRADLLAGGWIQGPDKLWRKRFKNAEWLPTCDVGHVTHSIVRDSTSGVLISDSAHVSTSRRPMPVKAFKRRRDVDVCAEVDLSADKESGRSWEDEELCPKEASEYRAAAARLNYLALDRPDILFASKECSRRMSAPRNGDWTAIKRIGRVLDRVPKDGLEICMAAGAEVCQHLLRLLLGRVQ